MPWVEVTAWERSIEQKRGLVKDITDAVCKNYNVLPQSVLIHLHDIKKENSASRGKLAIDKES